MLRQLLELVIATILFAWKVQERRSEERAGFLGILSHAAAARVLNNARQYISDKRWHSPGALMSGHWKRIKYGLIRVR